MERGEGGDDQEVVRGCKGGDLIKLQGDRSGESSDVADALGATEQAGTGVSRWTCPPDSGGEDEERRSSQNTALADKCRRQ